MAILIHCPVSHGGIAEHAHYQAQALSALSVDSQQEVVMLCAPNFLAGRAAAYRRAEVFGIRFADVVKKSGRLSRVLDVVIKSSRIVVEQWQLAWEVWRRKPEAVLLSSYIEYLSPFWVWPHVLLAKWQGVIYVANLHDPLRDYVVGPRWWHDFSVRIAYWHISVGVVHEKLPEPCPVPLHVRLVEAPVGVYELQESPGDPAKVRTSWSVPQNALVFLAFGYIRDNKNLDLVIRALTSCPRACLVVMGKVQSKKDKQLEFYRSLADELCVSNRVRFFDAFVPDEQLATYFGAADVIVLTYSKTFRSQSGVLNIAAKARRPVLASAGESPLKSCVEKFHLGVFVAPDNFEALVVGMKNSINSCELINQSIKALSDECAEGLGRRSKAGDQKMDAGSCEEMIEQSPCLEGPSIASSMGSPYENSVHICPNWEGYEAFASWQTNAAVILKAINDCQADSSA